MSIRHPKTYLLLATLVGAVVGYGLSVLANERSLSAHDAITELTNKIAMLESQLTQKDQELSSVMQANFIAAETADAEGVASESVGPHESMQNADSSAAAPARDIQQLLKDLGTNDDFNPRPFSERVNDLMTANPDKESAALASKSVLDMAANTDALPNYELEAVYRKQTDPDLKRVTAQVLSMRGDNSLLEKTIADSQAALRSDNPEVRQKALVEVGKTHYAGAVNLIAPLLHDKNTGVQLDALLALRATGNQSHVHLVQDLVNHPDPSVSWLAQDVINTIQNLSEKARTRVASSDIAAELPPITSELYGNGCGARVADNGPT